MLRSKLDGEQKIIYGKQLDENYNNEYEVVEHMHLLEWLTENYHKFGVELELVGDKTPEGSQFCKGFGGIGGFLRYKMNFNDHDDDRGNYDDHDDDGDNLEEFF